MQLYFLRHGPAAPRGEWMGDDSQRPLTEQGRKAVSRVAKLLSTMGLSFDAIVTSPYVRSRETAEIVARHLDLQDEMVSDERLVPGFDAIRLGKVLKKFPDARRLLLVGHEPDFTTTIGQLTGGRVVLKKGGMAYVEVNEESPGQAVLVWLIQPGFPEA